MANLERIEYFKAGAIVKVYNPHSKSWRNAEV